jgi:O-antigen/teichoic acid export membrane protein
VFPGLAAAAAGSPQPRAAFLRALGLAAVLIVAVATAIEAAPRLLLRVTFGPEYQAAAPVLRVLVCSYAALGLAYVAEHALLAAHRRAAALPVLALAGAVVAILARHHSALQVAQAITGATVTFLVFAMAAALWKPGPAR